jgi:hypothetical protein
LSTQSDQALIPELELIKEEETVSIASRYEQRWKDNFATRVRASSLFAALTTSRSTAGTSIAALRLAPSVLTWGARWSGKAQPPRTSGLAA